MTCLKPLCVLICTCCLILLTSFATTFVYYILVFDWPITSSLVASDWVISGPVYVYFCPTHSIADVIQWFFTLHDLFQFFCSARVNILVFWYFVDFGFLKFVCLYLQRLFYGSHFMCCTAELTNFWIYCCA